MRPDPKTPRDDWLLSDRLRAAAERLEAGADDEETDAIWAQAENDLAAAGADEDADIALPVLERSLPMLRSLLDAWTGLRRPLPPHDREILKRALKAYRKRLKLVRLDDESSSGRNPLSKGESSGITGVKAPEQFPREIWDALIAQGKLRDGGYGLLELAE